MAAMLSSFRAIAAPLAVAVALLLGGCGGSDDDTTTTTATAATAQQPAGPELGPAFDSIASLPGALKTPPPWPANTAKLQQRLRAIGLAPLTEEGQVLHIHQHLDIFVNGKPVEVPGDLGIGDGFISDLHTHASYPAGIIHVESPTEARFSLGQFFAVWGVPLSATTIGSLREQGDKQLKAWVDGKPVTADPTRIVLAEHQQIVLAYGTPAQEPKPVPATLRLARRALTARTTIGATIRGAARSGEHDSRTPAAPRHRLPAGSCRRRRRTACRALPPRRSSAPPARSSPGATRTSRARRSS